MSTKKSNEIKESSSLSAELLCISYFDQIIGPNQFYCNEPLDKESIDHPNLNRIMEFNEEPGSFIFAFRKYQTVNLLFNIDSKVARGGQELIMISYMVRASYFRTEIVDVFKYLEDKKSILEEYAETLKSLGELPSILHMKNKSTQQKNLLYLGTKEFRKKFLDLHDKYFKKLSPRFEMKAPIQFKEVPKKVFIFGERHVGKTTFLHNIEAIQFHNQINNDLPTMIYTLVVDNIEILTYDCIEKDFECERCKNYGGCIKNAQGFILLFRADDESSFLNAKEKLRKIIDRCDELENDKIPLIIIGNKFNDKEDISSTYVHELLNLKELEDCEMKVKYYSINVMKEDRTIMKSLRWLVRHMI
ncbi:MAG: ADP-ribosylation factor-like protein [Candidatus Hermodarchaeota archaeon]